MEAKRPFGFPPERSEEGGKCLAVERGLWAKIWPAAGGGCQANHTRPRPLRVVKIDGIRALLVVREDCVPACGGRHPERSEP